ncbi:MAG: DUF2088 domain-containing protein [Chloroflexi bacterium]|nr:DUF2088 domain-containing protein [Chloroflexota bacterium]
MATTTAQHTYALPWNGQERVLALPAERITAEVRFTDKPALPDPAGAILSALDNPIGAPPLADLVRPGAKVALLTGDRMTDRMLGTRDGLAFPLLDRLNALGVRDEDVSIVYACGMHAHGHARERLGEKVLARVRMVEHEAMDDAQMVYVGVTSRGTPVWVNRVVAEADVRLAIGEVSPVGPAGWCGGGKIILPGVAGRDTIEHNHRMVLSPEARLGAINRNPVRLDIEEAAELAHLDLKVDVLVNSAERIVAVYAGDFRQEWRAAVAAAKEIWTTPMEPTDIAVVYPGDTRERYLGGAAYMTFGIGEAMTRPEGAVIVTLSAAGGWSSDPTSDRYGATEEGFSLTAEEMARRLVRSEGNLRSWSNAYMAKAVLERKPFYLHCDGYTDAQARRLGFAGAYRSLEDALAAATERVGRPEATISTCFPRGIQWRMMPRVPD